MSRDSTNYTAKVCGTGQRKTDCKGQYKLCSGGARDSASMNLVTQIVRNCKNIMQRRCVGQRKPGSADCPGQHNQLSSGTAQSEGEWDSVRLAAQIVQDSSTGCPGQHKLNYAAKVCAGQCKPGSADCLGQHRIMQRKCACGTSKALSRTAQIMQRKCAGHRKHCPGQHKLCSESVRDIASIVRDSTYYAAKVCGTSQALFGTPQIMQRKCAGHRKHCPGHDVLCNESVRDIASIVRDRTCYAVESVRDIGALSGTPPFSRLQNCPPLLCNFGTNFSPLFGRPWLQKLSFYKVFGGLVRDTTYYAKLKCAGHRKHCPGHLFIA